MQRQRIIHSCTDAGNRMLASYKTEEIARIKYGSVSFSVIFPSYLQPWKWIRANKHAFVRIIQLIKIWLRQIVANDQLLPGSPNSESIKSLIVLNILRFFSSRCIVGCVRKSPKSDYVSFISVLMKRPPIAPRSKLRKYSDFSIKGRPPHPHLHGAFKTLLR